MLAKTAGVKHLIILINKMDDPTVFWDEQRYSPILHFTQVLRGATAVFQIRGVQDKTDSFSEESWFQPKNRFVLYIPEFTSCVYIYNFYELLKIYNFCELLKIDELLRVAQFL